MISGSVKSRLKAKGNTEAVIRLRIRICYYFRGEWLHLNVLVGYDIESITLFNSMIPFVLIDFRIMIQCQHAAGIKHRVS